MEPLLDSCGGQRLEVNAKPQLYAQGIVRGALINPMHYNGPRCKWELRIQVTKCGHLLTGVDPEGFTATSHSALLGRGSDDGVRKFSAFGGFREVELERDLGLIAFFSSSQPSAL